LLAVFVAARHATVIPEAPDKAFAVLAVPAPKKCTTAPVLYVGVNPAVLTLVPVALNAAEI
jgi:hypothetical protein